MRNVSSPSIGVCLACTALFLAIPGYAAEVPSSLRAAKDFYRAANFERAVPLLHAAVRELELQGDAESDQLTDAYLYLGMSYCALGDSEAAKDAFRKLLGIDPSRRLDPSIHAPKVIDLFERARQSLPPEPAAVPTPSRLPRDRWLTVELGRQQTWMPSREAFMGLEETPFDEPSGPVDFAKRYSPDFPANNTQNVRLRLPRSLGDVTYERRSRVYGRYSGEQPEGVDPLSGIPVISGHGTVTLESYSIVWSRPFWSGTTLWRRPFQHRWELGHRHVRYGEHLLQTSWTPSYQSVVRSSISALSIHGARGGLAMAVDLGRGFTVDLGLGGTLFFEGSEQSRRERNVVPNGGSEDLHAEFSYGLHAQGQIDGRLQWDALRLRWGGLHVALKAFYEFGGPAGSVQPNATIATRGVSAVIGLDLGPRP